MENNKAVLYMLTETKYSMMSFVIITKENRAIVIDGRWEEDMPRLKQYIGGREIAAWILTHPHKDHISGFVSEMKKDGGKDFNIAAIYHHFPNMSDMNKEKVADIDYYKAEFLDILPEFNRILPVIKSKVHIVEQGSELHIDGIVIEFLFTYHDYLTSNVMNDSSLVFKVISDKHSVLFLGDIGPQGGDVLYWESRDKLKADIVQMAHHGHVNCGLEVYAAINPDICLWCTDQWLYDEPEVPEFLADFEQSKKRDRTRMFGTAVTRRWMEQLGVKQHYYTKDGTQQITI